MNSDSVPGNISDSDSVVVNLSSDSVLGTLSDTESFDPCLDENYEFPAADCDLYNALLVLENCQVCDMPDMERFITRILHDSLRPENCFQMIMVSERYDILSLAIASHSLLEREFETLTLTLNFTLCPYRIVRRLIASERIVVRSELSVFQAVLRWVEQDETERGGYLDALLAYVRFHSFTDVEFRFAACQRLGMNSPLVSRAVFSRFIEPGSVQPDFVRSRCYRAPRLRTEKMFTFMHTQRAASSSLFIDISKALTTAWSYDHCTKKSWRLVFHLHDTKSERGYMFSAFLQGRNGVTEAPLNVPVRCEIFILNHSNTFFTFSRLFEIESWTTPGEWGFHRFFTIAEVLNPDDGYLNMETDSVIIGAHVELL